MLSNAYFLAKFRFDTAENEPAKNLQNFAKKIQNLPINRLHLDDEVRELGALAAELLVAAVVGDEGPMPPVMGLPSRAGRGVRRLRAGGAAAPGGEPRRKLANL